MTLQAFDALHRPLRLWARDAGGAAVSLRERLEYGDGGAADQPADDRAAARAANLLGALSRHHDEAGVVDYVACDFKGNVREKHRRVISDAAVLAVFPSAAEPVPDWRIAAFRVDWQPPAGTPLADLESRLLDAAPFDTTAGYDALNRVTTTRYPRDVDGSRAQLRLGYSRSGALQDVVLDGRTVVEHIAYDAKGRRTLVVLGNGVLTRYAYDPRTFRLRRLRSERFTTPAPGSLRYRPTGAALQDLGYDHDLAGNVLRVVERVPGCGVAANPEAAAVADPALRALVAQGDALVRDFRYDAVYRLATAGGRECRAPEAEQPWLDLPRCGFGSGAPTPDNAPQVTAPYRQAFEYDDAGNLLRLRHHGGSGTSVRRFTLAAATNRLESVATGRSAVGYAYDACGNLVAEGEARHLEWDHSDRLRVFRTQVAAAEPSVHATYLYDAAGERVKKVIRRQGGLVSSSVSVDGVYEMHRFPGAGAASENTRLHVAEGGRRLLTVRVGPAHPDDGSPAVQHHLCDHVGNVTVVVDDTGALVNREEYTPFGQTSLGSFARKGFRFAGRERDEESGLGYHGARYYAPWLARWVSPDPAGLEGGANPYAYADDDPVTLADPGGLQPRRDVVSGCACYSGHHEATPSSPPAIDPEKLEYWHRIATEAMPTLTFWENTPENFAEALAAGLPPGEPLTDFERRNLKYPYGDWFRVVPDSAGRIEAYVMWEEGSVEWVDVRRRSGERISFDISEAGLAAPDLLPSLVLGAAGGFLGGAVRSVVGRGLARSASRPPIPPPPGTGEGWKRVTLPAGTKLYGLGGPDKPALRWGAFREEDLISYVRGNQWDPAWGLVAGKAAEYVEYSVRLTAPLRVWASKVATQKHLGMPHLGVRMGKPAQKIQYFSGEGLGPAKVERVLGRQTDR
jgi:RHS repeat-associated protein